MPSYKFSYRNRDEKRGGCVGSVYEKDCVTYKKRNDIDSLDDFLEYLSVENKISPYLIGGFYQHNFKNAKKIKWIGKQTQFYLQFRKLGTVL